MLKKILYFVTTQAVFWGIIYDENLLKFTKHLVISKAVHMIEIKTMVLLLNYLISFCLTFGKNLS
jgi:hypothetical protein